MSADVSCTATFTLQAEASVFVLTVSRGGDGEGTVTSSPSGISCGSDCEEGYGSGTVVTLTPAPATGSTFGGWSGDGDCSDGVVTMSGERNCTATFSAQPSGLAAPELLAPINNAAVVQNNPSIGCSLNPDRGYGFEIAFDWTDVAAAVEYDLFATHRGAPLPLVDTQVSDSDHTDTRCGSFVIDSNLDDWDWRVRARDAQGNTGNWSQTATFRFEPCRLAGGASCGSAPPPPPSPVTLTFSGVSGSFSGYAQSGFTVSPTSGTWIANSYGNPGPSIQFQSAAGETTTAEIRITAGGSTLRFLAVELYSSTTQIPYVFTGVRNGSTVFTVSNTQGNTFGNFVTVNNPSSLTTIDTLFIHLTNPAAPCCPNPVGPDNIVVVP